MEEDKKKFVCWYAYSAMETEGRTEFEQAVVLEGEDKAEAMWKYHRFLFKHGRMGDIRERYKDLNAFRKKCDRITGWGYHCEQILLSV